MKKILFVNFNCSWPVHFETELELMQNHILKGDEVFSLSCKKMLNKNCIKEFVNSCDENSCSLCRKKYTYGMDLLGLKNCHRFALKKIKDTPDYVTKKYNSVDEIAGIEYNDVVVGRLVITNLLEKLHSIDFDLNDYQTEVYNLLKTYHLVYENIKVLCQEIKPDIVITFNGRFTEYVPIVNYCKHNNINFYLHERGSNLYKYNVWKNCSIHSLKNWIELCENSSTYNSMVIKEIASKWYNSRRFGEDQNWTSFTRKQKRNCLPENFDNTKHNVVFYNSSIWEFINFDDWQPNSCFKNEIDIYKAVSKHFKYNINYHFYLRVHPHLGEIGNNSQLDNIKDFEDHLPDNFTIINHNDKVDSYELLRSSDIIVASNASTIAVEACYWGKPSICIGKAMFQNSDACYFPQTMSELLDLLSNMQLEPKAKENSYNYAYMMATFGIKYNYYKPKTLFSGEFRGVDLNDIELYFKKTSFSKLRRFFKRQIKSITKRLNRYKIV